MVNQLRKFYEYLSKLNLFETETNDEHEKGNEVLSTKIYIIILFIILALYVSYSLLFTQTNIFTISNPTQREYEKLRLRYPDDLKCPCRYLSIPYKKFISIEVEYNEICSSDFIKQKWIDYFLHEEISFYHPRDFRRNAPFKFQLLRTLCQQSQETLENGLAQFHSNHFITNETISSDKFHIQVNELVSSFQKTTISSFENLIQLIHETACTNYLVAAIETRFVTIYERHSDNTIYQSICYSDSKTKAKVLGCICTGEDADLLSEGIYSNIYYYDYAECYPSRHNNSNSQKLNFRPTLWVSGMVIGCLPIISLMYSTLECLFNQQCLNQIGLYVKNPSISINNFSILKEDILIRKKTIESFAKKLFVKNWNIVPSYKNYFSYCQPLYCQYFDEQRNSFFYIFTTTISLFGGLKLILPWIVLYLVTFIRKKKQQRSADIDNQAATLPIRIRLLTFLKTIKNSIAKLNIFNSYSTDEHKQKNEILSTRIYLIVLIISLIIFAFYFSSEKQIRTKLSSNPTRMHFEKLQDASVDHLQCPCSQISIKYSEFIQFQPTYHQICSSIFVSPLWNRWGSMWTDLHGCFSPDFWSLASDYFFVLSAYCQKAHETILHELVQFYVMGHITPRAVHVKEFDSEITSLLDNFKIKIQKSFQTKLNIIRTVIRNNRFQSRLQPDSKKVAYVNGIKIEYLPKEYENCTPQTDSTCHRTMFFCRNNTFTYLPDLAIAQYLVDSLLLSKTTCFYDKNCIDIIKNYLNPTSELYKTLKPLKTYEKSQYERNATIETLVGNLFVEKWSDTYDYDKYYNACKPSQCSYKIESKPNFIYIVTRIIGVYGGLSIVIRFLIPNIVRIIRTKKGRQQNSSRFNRLKSLLQSWKKKLVQLNLFRNQSTDHDTLRKQILSTRLYIIVFAIILFICVLYTSINSKLVTKKLSFTNLTQFEQLYIKYPKTLICPCSEMLIKHEDFIKLTPVYHEVCSSMFVNQKWLDYLDVHHLRGFRFNFSDLSLSFQYQMIRSLCRLMQETINSTLFQFYSTTWISNQLISKDTFDERVDVVIKFFQRSTQQLFTQTFQATREIFHANTFITNDEKRTWKYTGKPINGDVVYMRLPRMYTSESCSCATSLNCSEQAMVNGTSIDGLFIGCYPVEAVLRSSLKCLYNKTCLDFISSNFRQDLSIFPVEVLQSATKYGIHETVQHMIDRLFIDDWNINCSYLNYTEKCHSTECSYSYVKSYDILYTITTILHVHGWLTILLSLLIPFIINISFRVYYSRRQMFIEPDT